MITVDEDLKKTLQGIVEQIRQNMATIRTGRASSSLIENIAVTTYGGQATLKIIELATITNNGPQELLVVPFDSSVLPDIEQKLRDSNMGFSVSVTGNQIRITMPPLTQEQREKYLKIIAQYAEEGRELIRRERDEVRKKIKQDFEAKELSEDQKYRYENEVDKISKEYSDKIEALRERKEEEIKTI